MKEAGGKLFASFDEYQITLLQAMLSRMSCTAANLQGAIMAVAAFSQRFEFSDVHGIDAVQDGLADALIAAEGTYVGALRDE